MRRVCLMLAMVVWVQSLGAQTVVQPEPPLDSARANVRDALLVLRDSLSTIDAAAGRLQRDYREASVESLLSRARVMRDACARSARTVVPTREAVSAAKTDTDLRRKRRQELLAALNQLGETLARCESEFGAMSKPGQAERVRGYANDRALKVQAATRQYSRAAGVFLAALGIKVPPLAAEARSSAG